MKSLASLASPLLRTYMATKAYPSVIVRSINTSTQEKQKFYQLLVDTYRLQTDEAYKFQGRQEGIYAWLASPNRKPDDTNNPVNHFAAFIGSLRERNLLPSWWTSAEDTHLYEYAKPVIFYTLERSDLMDIEGNQTERFVQVKSFMEALK